MKSEASRGRDTRANRGGTEGRERERETEGAEVALKNRKGSTFCSAGTCKEGGELEHAVPIKRSRRKSESGRVA